MTAGMLEDTVKYKPVFSLKNAISLCEIAFGKEKVLECKKCQQGIAPKRKIYKYIIKLSFFVFLAFVRIITGPAITWLCNKGVSDFYSVFVIAILMLISAFVVPFIVSWISLPIWTYIIVAE